MSTRALKLRTLLALGALALSLFGNGCLDPCTSCGSSTVNGGPGTFIRGANMLQDRADHTASLLTAGADAGMMLIAGGARFPGYLSGAEIYDPATGRFSPDGVMNRARAGHTATLLGNGDVLVAGGTNGLEALQSAEVYLPGTGGAAGKFNAVGNLFAPRVGHTATLLGNGEVLIAGGSPAVTQAPSLLVPGVTDVILDGALDSAELYEPGAQAFVGNDDAMVTTRTEHSATMLNSGEVLLVGGLDDKGRALASAALYNPANGSFTATGSMHTPRYLQTATLLFDGRVLITGGLDENHLLLASAEIYDPATGTFSSAGNMTASRVYHTATLNNDADHTVTIAGGATEDSSGGLFLSTDSAEVYDPVAKTFTAIAGMNDARAGHSATALSDGTALIVGGGQTDTFGGFLDTLPSAELYSPNTESFTPVAASLTRSRAQQTATRLSDGRVLIAGGYNSDAKVTFASTEVYDPTANRFEPGPSMVEAHVFHTATVLNDGDVLITSGDSGDSNAELYSAANNAFSLTNGPMTAERFFATATKLGDGTVLIAGGQNDVGGSTVTLDTAETYDPSSGTFTATASPMTTARWDQTAALLNDGTGRVLIAGGTDSSGNPLQSAELYNPATRSFTASAGEMTVPRSDFTATALPGSDLILLAGGSGDNSAEVYDPATDSFTAVGLMNDIRFGQTVTPLANGMILLAGGQTINNFQQIVSLASAELYAPSKRIFVRTGSMNIARSDDTAIEFDNGRVIVAGGLGIGTTLASTELYQPPAGAPSTAAGAAAPVYRSVSGASEVVMRALSADARAVAASRANLH